MQIRATNVRSIRTCALGALAATALVVTSCGSSGGDSSSEDTTPTTVATETTEAPDTTEAPATTEAPDTTIEDGPTEGDDIPGGLIMMGDKSILLDGFIGMDIPEGWEIVEAQVPLTSETEGDETELDIEAIQRVLVLGPVDDPGGASFVVAHYTHSDKVPEFALFSKAIGDFAAADGGTVSEPQASRIGGQEAALYQVATPDGDTGLVIPFQAGDEYFFIFSLVPDKSYAADTAAIVTSLSLEPGALHA